MASSPRATQAAAPRRSARNRLSLPLPVATRAGNARAFRLTLAAFQVDRAHCELRRRTAFARHFLINAPLPWAARVLRPNRHGVDFAIARHDDRARNRMRVVRRHGLDKNGAAPRHIDMRGCVFVGDCAASGKAADRMEQTIRALLAEAISCSLATPRICAAIAAATRKRSQQVDWRRPDPSRYFSGAGSDPANGSRITARTGPTT